MGETVMNPAQKAAQRAQQAIHECIEQHQSFLLEAGAGAGKTYSLIKALQYVIEKEGAKLLRRHQQVACITYTNVASNEVTSRTGAHPVIFSATIHSFCWALLKDFQPHLREKLCLLPQWQERIAEMGSIGRRRVEYDLGHRGVRDDCVTLGHDDVISLMVALLDQQKFRDLLTSRYPVMFIDEYQDTNAEFAAALKNHFLGKDKALLIGFYGDHWQKIYDNVCGRIMPTKRKGLPHG